jgi:hypothetical protein
MHNICPVYPYDGIWLCPVPFVVDIKALEQRFIAFESSSMVLIRSDLPKRRGRERKIIFELVS